ncbi:ubiquinone biosynthesis monooxygenase Coq7 [Oryzisolibacter propanilivorax]|uniref:3-demethoxyubiquinol 3-hydroxylase n=1 Tax=Oryzisolibacter propanilivorax TaxID=1527607 RepID=A0A1G9VBU5_9BURK|nr:2-polyprenyl-3-methyl-6-methoxy-1,4-benzoquinone monooxygenase [Oryzisolibacter propanilivorax]SDM69601.1 ubiquinone biosynthesis monooxygenase Coq7 [Oryzisolibacter propanilivorax]
MTNGRLLTATARSEFLLIAADTALRTLLARSSASQPSPARGLPLQTLTAEQARLSAALMRVNHVGEVCAQALYMAQACVTRDESLRQGLLQAAHEETDHLAWTRERLDQLRGRPSLLNPLWFGGAFAIGLGAARVSDAVSLGFVAETERQVSKHLQDHLQRLPAQDLASRAVVARMQGDEARHAAQARAAGAAELPAPARWLMRAAAKVMTTVAHRI